MRKIYTFKTLIIVVSLLLLFNFRSLAYNSIWVNNPHSQDWNSDQGSIDNVTFTVVPKGIYMECELELTLSAQETIYSLRDTVEITFDFGLPAGSMISNAYLLIEDSLVEARLMERWAATQIYENIVQRVRRDPLILYKQYGDQYYAKIYPMVGNSSRTMIIKYLVPATWTKNYASIILPTDIIGASKVKPEKIYVIVQPDEDWNNPKILEIPNALFKSYITNESVTSQILEIRHSGENFSALTLGFDNPMENGLYVKTYDIGGEGFYQMAFLPSEVLDINTPKKVAIIIDHDQDLTYVSKSEMLIKLESCLNEYFTENDYFNIIYYDGSSVNIASEDWIKATKDNISDVFVSGISSALSDTNKIELLLANTVEYIENSGNDASILILSSANYIKNNDEADKLIAELKKTIDPLPQINTINMMEKYWYWYDYVADVYYWGNDYLYSELAKLTKGEYFTVDYYNTFGSLITKMFQSFDGIITSFDIHTSMDEGFCYSRYNINGDGAAYLNKPVLQTGKYYGSFPFKVEISALKAKGLFNEIKKFNKSSVNINDKALEQIWAGNYICDLENTGYNYTATQEIIDISIKYHILSSYTAFLALEPGMSYEVPDDIEPSQQNTRGFAVDMAFTNEAVSYVDDGNNYSSYGDERGQWYVDENFSVPAQIENDEVKSSLILNGFPNPFVNYVTIKLSFTDEIDLSKISVRIVSITGELIHVFNNSNLGLGTDLEIVWDGSNGNGSQILEGTYVVTVFTPTEIKTVKLMKTK